MYELSLVKNWNVLLIDETWVKRLVKKNQPKEYFLNYEWIAAIHR